MTKGPHARETRRTSEEIREELFEGPAAQALLAQFMVEIRALYPDWDPARASSADAVDFEPPVGRFLVAYAHARPVGCGGLKRLNDRAAEVKRLYVAPEARRSGLGRRILDGLEQVAAGIGYQVLRLDTGPEQPYAHRLFIATGYHEVPDYNANPYAAYWFEKVLGQARGPVIGLHPGASAST